MKTVIFDFDGVIHSYTSGWKGATVIPDPPVPGIREIITRLRRMDFEVVVQSARCHESNPGGKQAIEDYLALHGIEVDRVTNEKPPAIVTVDDRAICFKGTTEGLLEQILTFKPWNKKEVTEDE